MEITTKETIRQERYAINIIIIVKKKFD